MKVNRLTVTLIGLLLGAIITFVVLMLTGFIFPYGSTEFGNWAMWFGTISASIAAVGAIFAANFTRKTLYFLIKQHDDQLEMQIGPLYLEHKRAFFDLLEQLERNHSNKFTFQNKEVLYQALFPMNDFFTFSAKSPLKSSNGDLHEMISGINNTYKKFGDPSSTPDYSLRHFQFIDAMKSSLHIAVFDDNSIGNVYTNPMKNKKLLWNVFEINLLIQFIYDATGQLYKFTGNEAPIETTWQCDTQVVMVTKAIESTESASKGPNPIRALNLQGDTFNIIMLLAKFMVLMHGNEIGHLKNYDQWPYFLVRNLFESNVDRFGKLMTDLPEQYDLLARVVNWLKKKKNENSQGWEKSFSEKVDQLILEMHSSLNTLKQEMHV